MASVPDVSRTERRTRAQAAADAERPMRSEQVLSGLGLARVRPGSAKWFAYRLDTNGNVTPLTPLHNGEMRGEGMPNATGRLKMALLRIIGGLDE